MPRRATSLAVITVLVTAAALAFWGVRTAVLDETRFADGLAASLERAPVRDALGTRAAAAIVDARPDLVAVEPALSAGIAAVADTSGVRSIVRGAARQLHRALIAGDESAAVLVAANLAVFADQALREVDADAAKRIPAGVRVTLVDLKEGLAADVAREAGEGAARLRLVAWLLTLLAAALLVATATSGGRRGGKSGHARVSSPTSGGRRPEGGSSGRALAAAAAGGGLQRAALSLTGGGVLAAAVMLIAGWAIPAGIADEDLREAARGILATLLAPAVSLGFGVAAAGAIAAVAVHAVTRPEPLSARLRRAIEAARETPRGRAAGNGLLVVAGVVLVLEPAFGARAAAVLAGVALVIAGLEGLLRGLLPARSHAADADAEEAGGDAASPVDLRARRRRVARRAAAGTVVIVAAVAVAGGTRAATDVPRTDLPCNGERALCSKRLDQVVLPATHNSFSAAQDGFLLANQRTGMAEQLAGGVRGFLIDTHFGARTDRGVYTLLDEETKSRDKLEEAVGPSATRTALRIRGQLGISPTHPGEPKEVYLCHGFCELGAVTLRSQLEAIDDALTTDPGAVLVISVEDGVPPADFAQAVQDSPLADRVWTGPVDPLPTLGAMVRADRRVLFLVEEDAGDVPWLHPQFDLAQETPYDLPDAAAVLAPATGCAANRGGSTPPLLLLNAFVSAVPPPVAAAKRVNARGALVDLARECAARRDRVPTLLAVDHWEVGDVVGAARELNTDGV